MASNLTGAVSRPEISQFLEESKDADKFFIANKILPAFTVKSRAGRFPRIYRNTGELLKTSEETLRRGPTGSFNEISRKTEWDNYQLEELGLEERIDDVLKKEMNTFFSQERITAKLLLRYVMLHYERRVANLLSDATVFNSTNMATALTEANLATVDFPRDLMEAQERMERKALIGNTLVMTRAVWNRIRRSTRLQTFLYGNIGAGTGQRLIEASDVANAFGVPNIMIAASTVDTANKGQDPSLETVWPNDYIYLANISGGDFSSGGLGRTLIWGADSPGGLFSTDSRRDENRLSTIMRVRTNSIEKILDFESMELIATNYA